MPDSGGTADHFLAQPPDREKLAALLSDSLAKPSAARVYDYYLGGNHNWAIDRVFAEQQIRQWPDTPWLIKQNRKFLVRAVRSMLRQGIRQFVDIGSGLPTEGNVHEIADEGAPGESTVVYVDHDPVVHAHSTLLLERTGDPARHHTVHGDLLDCVQLWQSVLDTGVIDRTRPLALLMVAVVHLIPDEREPEKALSYLRSVVAPGSFLGLSHGTIDGLDAQERAQLAKVQKDYNTKATSPLLGRNREEILDFFGDWELMPPGLTWTSEWHDAHDHGQDYAQDVQNLWGGTDAARSRMFAGVARKSER